MAEGRRLSLLIVVSVAVMLSLSMGVRQSLGLFMQPVTADIGVSIAGFTLAIAVQIRSMFSALMPATLILPEFKA